MAGNSENNDLQEIFKASLEEAKKKARARSKKREEEEEEGEEEEEEGEEEEEEGSSKSKKRKMEESKEEEEEEEESSKKPRGRKKKKMEEEVSEETMAASSLHPAARSVPDPKAINSSKVGMMQNMLGMMNGMGKDDMVNFFNTVMAQFGPGKDYGVGDNSAHNSSTIDMKPSHAVASGAPKTKYPMPKLNVKEDVEEMFSGEELSEEFKEKASTLFEAAVNARVITEVARLEESYAETIAEELNNFAEEVSTNLNTYLEYVAEHWMKENEVAIESAIRNELMEEFIEGLRNLFNEHYINIPQEKVDVLEAMAEKVNMLETKLDEVINENVELKSFVIEDHKEKLVENIASNLTLTQKEKFASLAEGIEFNGDLDVFEKKLKIIKENYFKTENTSYASNINEETFEGDIDTNTGYVDPNVNRYVQAIARSVKK